MIFRMNWYANSFIQKSKDKWMGTLSFTFSMVLGTKNLVRKFYHLKNLPTNFGFEIINNGFFFQSIFNDSQIDETYRFDGLKLNPISSQYLEHCQLAHRILLLIEQLAELIFLVLQVGGD